MGDKTSSSPVLLTPSYEKKEWKINTNGKWHSSTVSSCDAQAKKKSLLKSSSRISKVRFSANVVSVWGCTDTPQWVAVQILTNTRQTTDMTGQSLDTRKRQISWHWQEFRTCIYLSMVCCLSPNSSRHACLHLARNAWHFQSLDMAGRASLQPWASKKPLCS
jgi:hypothetical protein